MTVTRLRTFTLALVALLGCIPLCTSCASSATGPQGLDPTVLLVNNLPPVGSPCANNSCPDTVFLAWWDQSSQTALFKVAPGATLCTHFTSTLPTDSVRYVFWAGDTTGTPGAVWNKTVSPWFNPQTGFHLHGGGDQFMEYWTVTENPPNSPLEVIDSLPPC